MTVPRTLAALIPTASFIATACSPSGGSPGGSPSAAGQGLSSGDAGAVAIGTASSRSLGTFLTGPNGMTLYTHAGDGPNASTCMGVSATGRPPLTVAAGRQPTAGAGVTGKLPTLTQADGTTQVTYGGLPLYDWPGDPQPDDTPMTSRPRGAQS